MTEGKISMKDRARLGWKKIKMYPKIWISSLAVLCLLLGFVGGMSLGTYNSRTTHPREGMRPMEAFQDKGQQKMTPPDNNHSQNENQAPSSNSDDSNSSENGFETETN